MAENRSPHGKVPGLTGLMLFFPCNFFARRETTINVMAAVPTYAVFSIVLAP